MTEEMLNAAKKVGLDLDVDFLMNLDANMQACMDKFYADSDRIMEKFREQDEIMSKIRF